MTIPKQRQITLVELGIVIGDIECSVGGIDWEVHCGMMGDGFYVQLRYIEPDIETGDHSDQHGRKWYVSSYSTKSEIVQTVLMACKASGEHQIREHFTYRGRRVFSPHFNVDDLVDLAGEQKDVRIPGAS